MVLVILMEKSHWVFVKGTRVTGTCGLDGLQKQVITAEISLVIFGQTFQKLKAKIAIFNFS